jgi:hypothetical protein
MMYSVMYNSIIQGTLLVQGSVIPNRLDETHMQASAYQEAPLSYLVKVVDIVQGSA